MPIGEFEIGEHLLTANGSRATVCSLTKRPQRETVYNIEVDGEHVYGVGKQGLLVHNKCWSREYVYVIRNKVTKRVRYVGITKNYTARELAHKLTGNLKKGEEMIKVTKKITHAQARSLEGRLIREIMDYRDNGGDTYQIWKQLQQAGLRNLNRGRSKARWVPTPEKHLLDAIDFVDLVGS